MKTKISTKVKVGDVCEIQTPAGLAYVQLTHPSMGSGEVVRVLPGLFSTRPTDLASLVNKPELYFVFYTLSNAIREHDALIVANHPVPPWARPYPLMRWCIRDPSGKPIGWKIFKASAQLTVQEHLRTPVIRDLTPEQYRLSIRQLWPHPVMVKELAREWTPVRDEELRLQDVAKAKQAAAQDVEERALDPMKHYLYFPKKASAEAAGKWLRNCAFSVEVRKGADGESWLALAMKNPPKTDEQMDELRTQMESVATQFGGEYDGWEAAADSLGSNASTERLH